MKLVHGNKLMAIMEMKWRSLFSKNFVIMPVFTIGFTFVMKLIYGSLEVGGLGDGAKAMALGYGFLMNVSMTGIYCVCGVLAEEKEKHTLRVLMTSSVNGLEFFIGSLVPVIVMMMVVNGILVAVTQVAMEPAEWGTYLLVSLLAALASAVIGMVFGIFSKNQVSAGTVTLPGILILMMVPMFAGFSETVAKISELLFTGIAANAVTALVTGQGSALETKGLLVMVVEIVAAVICFLAVYKRNGYDPE